MAKYWVPALEHTYLHALLNALKAMNYQEARPELVQSLMTMSWTGVELLRSVQVLFYIKLTLYKSSVFSK